MHIVLFVLKKLLKISRCTMQQKIIFYTDKIPFSHKLPAPLLCPFVMNILIFGQFLVCSLYFLYFFFFCSQTWKLLFLQNYFSMSSLCWRMAFRAKTWVLCVHFIPGIALFLDYFSRNKKDIRFLIITYIPISNSNFAINFLFTYFNVIKSSSQ